MSDSKIKTWQDLASMLIAVRKMAGARPPIRDLAEIYAGELSRNYDNAGCIVFLIGEDGSSLLVSDGMQSAPKESDYSADMPLMRQLGLVRKGFFGGPEKGLTSDLFPGETPDALLCSPVIVRERVSGFVALLSSSPDAFSSNDLELIDLVSGELSISLDFAFLLSSLDAVTVTDRLTGCYNRKKFNDDIEVDIPCSERYGRPLSLIKIDIDFMEDYNQSYGIDRGDELIRKVAETLAYSIRMCDRLYRFSGEEFILILPGIDKERGVFAAQRLQKSLGQLRFENQPDDQRKQKITYSIGVASFPADAVFKDGLLKKLDTALLRAKSSGGNAVVSL